MDMRAVYVVVEMATSGKVEASSWSTWKAAQIYIDYQRQTTDHVYRYETFHTLVSDGVDEEDKAIT